MKKILLLILLFGCSTGRVSQTNLVFVHGAHFDERIFKGMKRFFPDQGKVVELPTSTGLGNIEDHYKKLTLNDYANTVCDVLSELPNNSVLVGHGLGGAVINQAFGKCPRKISGLIFIGATIPWPGETPYQLFTRQDNEFYLKAVEENEETGLYEIIDRYVFLEAFAQDANEEVQNLIGNISKSEPTLPTKSRLAFNLNSWQMLKKLVVVTTGDKVISPQTQKKFIVRMKNTNIKEIDSGHLPMVVKTDELGQIVETFINE